MQFFPLSRTPDLKIIFGFDIMKFSCSHRPVEELKFVTVKWVSLRSQSQKFVNTDSSFLLSFEGEI